MWPSTFKSGGVDHRDGVDSRLGDVESALIRTQRQTEWDLAAQA
jgi:hypothetical protein